MQTLNFTLERALPYWRLGAVSFTLLASDRLAQASESTLIARRGFSFPLELCLVLVQETHEIIMPDVALAPPLALSVHPVGDAQSSRFGSDTNTTISVATSRRPVCLLR